VNCSGGPAGHATHPGHPLRIQAIARWLLAIHSKEPPIESDKFANNWQVAVVLREAR
jgi:hypothetical protein